MDDNERERERFVRMCIIGQVIWYRCFQWSVVFLQLSTFVFGAGTDMCVFVCGTVRQTERQTDRQAVYMKNAKNEIVSLFK